MYLHISCFNVDRVLSIKFVETFSHVKQNLPYVIDISSPFVETSFNIQFEGFCIHERMEDWMFEHKTRTIAIWIVVGYLNFEPKYAFLIYALTNEYNTIPAC